MPSILSLVETIFKVFGNSPRLFLSIIGHHQSSESVARLSSRSMPKRLRSGRSSSKKIDGEPDPEPLAAPPIIILSQNSSCCGSQPQEQDPDPLNVHTSSPRSQSATPKQQVPGDRPSTASQHKPKPHPEPHPAPPVIILSRNKRAASSSPLASSPPSPRLRPRLLNGPVNETSHNTDIDSTHKRRTMGSKSSKLSPKNGKLQASQDKKDKDEMKEPTNYYTHRSKSMRRKAGKGSAGDGAGGISMGSGGAGGAI